MTGLVLEGGAMRGMYTSGVLDAFLDMGIDLKYIIGVSAGISFGASYASKQIGRNIEIYRKYLNDKRYISYRNMLKEGSLFGLKFVFEDIPKIYIPFDFDTFNNSKTRFITVVTDIVTGKPKYFEKNEIDDKFNVFKATCALPIFSPIIKINSGKYLDGGMFDPIPIKRAISDGCEKNIIILTQHKGYKKTEQSHLKFIRTKYIRYPNVYKVLKQRHILYNETLSYIDQLENEGKVLVIRPKEPVGFKNIETNLEKLENLFRIGYNDAIEIKDKILNFIK